MSRLKTQRIRLGQRDTLGKAVFSVLCLCTNNGSYVVVFWGEGLGGGVFCVCMCMHVSVCVCVRTCVVCMCMHVCERERESACMCSVLLLGFDAVVMMTGQFKLDVCRPSAAGCRLCCH